LPLTIAFAGASACTRESTAGERTAIARLLDAQGTSVGTATFRQRGETVVIDLEVKGLQPGEHAVHIHNVGACHAEGEDGKAFTSAGPHFNPFNKQHGTENPEGPHAGDLPNITVGADGTAKARFENSLVTLADGPVNSLFQPGGTCLVIHAGPDDYRTDPAGNAGDRVACGVIERQ